MQLIKEARTDIILPVTPWYKAESIADMIASRKEVINHCVERWPFSEKVKENKLHAMGGAVILLPRLSHDIGDTSPNWRKHTLYDSTGFIFVDIPGGLGVMFGKLIHGHSNYELWANTTWLNRSAIVGALFRPEHLGEDVFRLINVPNFRGGSPTRNKYSLRFQARPGTI